MSAPDPIQLAQWVDDRSAEFAALTKLSALWVLIDAIRVNRDYLRQSEPGLDAKLGSAVRAAYDRLHIPAVKYQPRPEQVAA